jgi:hypothetical protein
MTKTKKFKVLAVSSNTNSFGLYGIVMVARDGTAYEVGANYLNKKNVGDEIVVSLSDTGRGGFAELGFEIPRQLPKAPGKIVKAIWVKRAVVAD